MFSDYKDKDPLSIGDKHSSNSESSSSSNDDDDGYIT